MDSKMIIHVDDGYKGEVKLEISPHETLAELRKKLIEKGAQVDPSSKFIAHGRVLSEVTPLQSQDVSGKSRLRQVPMTYN